MKDGHLPWGSLTFPLSLLSSEATLLGGHGPWSLLSFMNAALLGLLVIGLSWRISHRSSFHIPLRSVSVPLAA